MQLFVLTFVWFPCVALSAALSTAKSSLTLLYQNDLNGTDDANHVGFLLLDPLSSKDAKATCADVGEALVSTSQIKAHLPDFLNALSYVAYTGRASEVQQYLVSDGTVVVSADHGKLSFQSLPRGNLRLPALCTQSSTENQPTNAIATSKSTVSVTSTGNTYIGFRNQKSFRFLGIPYADPPRRFEYSSLFSPKGQILNATSYAPACSQSGSGEESCLFLNIQTPFLPKTGSKKQLRPVFFWIHGGGFTGGSAADPGTDGGNLASREDIVVVQIQYRLGTLGFLAIPGTNVTGNFGIADQITALQWVVDNIASFGGDPNQITIGGDSAGAGSVRTLLGSPPAKGKFQGAIAMSNLGGGVTLGLKSSYATTYSSYLTIEQSYALAGQNLFVAAGCNSSSLNEQIACLKSIPAQKVVQLSGGARYVVQDGKYVNTEQLDVINHNGSTAHVPAMFGVCHDDGASIGTSYPKSPVSSESAGLQASLGISAENAQKVIDSGLFPLYNTGNITLDSFNVSARVATDFGFRCVDEATMYAASQSGAFAASYYFEMERGIGGYDPNGLGGAPVTPGFPNGNPNLPSFRFHSGSTAPFIFGNASPLRDADDLYAAQLLSGYFAEFVKNGQPNPKQEYLKVRGYDKTLQAIRETGAWLPITDKKGPIRLLDYPATSSTFVDVAQCAFLNYSLSYYLDGGV